MPDSSGPSSGLHVLNPTVERHGGDPLSLAPRPSSLAGKTVGLLWNGKPNGDVALFHARKLMSARLPNTEFKFYSGSQQMAKELLAKAREECDVFVATTADCGSCTSWLVHDCVQLERQGRPTVIIASKGFEEDLEASAEAFSMGSLQYVMVPSIYNNISEDEARAQTEPVIPYVIDLLTGLRDVVAREETVVRETFETRLGKTMLFGGLEPQDAMWAFNRDFMDNDWGDGYPLWPPTPSKVQELMSLVDGSPDDLVCMLPPGNGAALVHLVAANAAMAGCRPEEMPVIMASLRAIAKNPSLAVRIALMSTSAHAPMVLVNGPIGRQLGINGARCCMGPGRQNEVNIRIGRAVLLCLKNIGRWHPGVLDLDTMGTLRKNIAVIAENAEETPWEEYHVDQGFAPEDSAVTVFFTSGEWDISLQGNLDEHQLVKAIGSFSGGNNSLGYFESIASDPTAPAEQGRLLLLAPPHAQPLSGVGYTKQQLEQIFFDLGHEPIHRLIEPARKVHKSGKIRPEWQWLFDLSEEETRTKTLPVIALPELYKIVVAGSVRGKNMLFPTRCRPYTERVTNTPAGN